MKICDLFKECIANKTHQNNLLNCLVHSITHSFIPFLGGAMGAASGVDLAGLLLPQPQIPPLPEKSPKPIGRYNLPVGLVQWDVPNTGAAQGVSL